MAYTRAAVALAVFLAFTLLIAVANLFADWSGGDDASPWMSASGFLLGFVAIPVFAVALPLWLSVRWNLPRSWWPRRGRVLVSLAVVGGYMVLANFAAIRTLAEQGADPARFAVHFTSAMLFHVPYYPLFAVLVFQTLRGWRGTPLAMLVTSAAFALYHLAQWHFFPDGTEPLWLFLLFLAFMADLALYLFTRSLILVALSHSLGGAANMASAGTWFDRVDIVFYLTVAIVGAILVWSIFDQRRLARAGRPFSDDWMEIRLP
jgi:membrane protease YdiL (CAAX protease family)